MSQRRKITISLDDSKEIIANNIRWSVKRDNKLIGYFAYLKILKENSPNINSSLKVIDRFNNANKNLNDAIRLIKSGKENGDYLDRKIYQAYMRAFYPNLFQKIINLFTRN